MITSVMFTSDTGGNDKDHDSGIYVRVWTSNRQTLIASIDNAANCDTCHYDNHTTHSFSLVVNSPSLSPADCANFVFQIGMRATGNDEWDVDAAHIFIHFDTPGTEIDRDCAGFKLNSRDSALVWSPVF